MPELTAAASNLNDLVSMARAEYARYRALRDRHVTADGVTETGQLSTHEQNLAGMVPHLVAAIEAQVGRENPDA